MKRLALSLTDFINAIPHAWLETSYWVCWKLEAREGKPTKIPYNPITGRKARSDDPKTWASLSVAHAWHEAHADSQGLGRMFPKDGGEVGIDLDHCIENGVVAPWALEMLSKRNTYAELSPSGTGIKIWTYGPVLPKGTRRSNYPVEGAAIEMYSHARFFTVTGERFEGCPREVVDATPSILSLYAQLNNRSAKKEQLAILPAKPLDDAALIEKARNAKNGATFSTLWSGNWQAAGFGSQSEADLALCNLLAFYTGNDAGRLDALFRSSGLYREKWEREDYGKATIEKALSGKTEFYGNGHARREEAAHVAAKWTPESIASISEIETIFSSESVAELALLKKRDGAAFARVKLALRSKFEKAFPVRDFERAITHAAKSIPRDHQKTSPLPEIEIGVDILACAKQGEAALGKSGVEVFWRSGGIGLVRILRDSGSAESEIKREKGTPIINLVEDVYCRALLSSVARWKIGGDDEKEEKHIAPPSDICKTVLELGAWPNTRYLHGIVTAPVLRLDGTILQTPGYDAATGLLAEFDSSYFLRVEENPTREDAKAALAELAEPFADFPFIAECDRSAAISSVLTLFARRAIDGCVPLFACRATTQGTGKSFIVDVASIIATGRIAPRMSEVETDEEWRKRLLVIALEGDSLTMIDNVMRPFGNGPLSMAVTSRKVKDRILGASKGAEAPFEAVIFATGNGMTFINDLPRRTVPIDLDAKKERPEERSGPRDGEAWRHPDLIAWTTENRPRLAKAALTILRAHAAVGRPVAPNVAPFGSFEEWSKIVRNALIWLDFPDPCEGRKRIIEAADPERDSLKRFLKAWYGAFLNTPQTLEDAWSNSANPAGDELTKNRFKDLAEAMRSVDWRASGDKAPSLKSIGAWLRNRIGRIVDNLKMEKKGENRSGVILWQVVKNAGSAGFEGLVSSQPSSSEIIPPRSSDINEIVMTDLETTPQTPQTPQDDKDEEIVIPEF